jgi:hypothetical protein
MLGAAFEHIHTGILKNNFSIYPFQTGGANADGKVVINIGAFRHGVELRF